jgi:hypothetical protein
LKVLLALLVIFGCHSQIGFSVQVLSEFENSKCEEFKLFRDLNVYKDPSLFIGNLGEMYNDPRQGWDGLMKETPILTTLQGTVYLMKLGGASEFRNFGMISKLYELADSRFVAKKSIQKSGIPVRPLVIPVKLCGFGYGDSLGYVLFTDFEKALIPDREEGSLPPSVYPNPVPNLRKG